MVIDLPSPDKKPPIVDVPNSGGLKAMVTVRDASSSGMPPNTKSVAVFLINARQPDELYGYRTFIYQVQMTLQCDDGFVPRPDPRDWSVQDEWDERVNDLHYHDSYEFVVGHGVSAEAIDQEGSKCTQVRTVWLPQAEVERVAPQEEKNLPGLVLSMEDLGALKDGADAKQKLQPAVDHYRNWIAAQRSKLAGLSPSRLQTANDMLTDAETAAIRIEAGIECLASEEDETVLDAFRIARRPQVDPALDRIPGLNRQLF